MCTSCWDLCESECLGGKFEASFAEGMAKLPLHTQNPSAEKSWWLYELKKRAKITGPKGIIARTRKLLSPPFSNNAFKKNE